MRIPRKLVQVLKNYDKIVVASHIGPEGDAIGSALALAMGLKSLGKQVEVVCHDGVPKRYAFLPSASEVKSRPSFQPELLVLVDCADLDRADIPDDLRHDAKSVLVIDHHPTIIKQDGREWISWIEPKFAATGEMIAVLLKALKVPMTKEIAICLYAALISDTGVFRFRNTKPETLRLAASLLEYGVDPQEMAYRVMEARSFGATKLLGKMLEKAEFEPAIGLCWSVLTRSDFTSTGTTDEDTENFVNFLGTADGVRVTVLFREVEPRFIKVSLRSRDEGINVADIARKFGGGGHPAAAGCKFRQPLSFAVASLLSAVRESLQSNPDNDLGKRKVENAYEA